MTSEAALVATRAAVLAEVFFGSECHLEATTAVPLTSDGDVVLALTFAEHRLAEALAAADRVALVVSDDRMALRGWAPLALLGTVTVEPGTDGRRFEEVWLDEELRKHPPSRRFADAYRDRRDHWWYLPRLICRLSIMRTQEVARRSDPTSGVLGWWATDGLQVDTVEVVDADDQALHLCSLSERALRGDDAPALLFRHDHSRPDLERRSARHEAGRLRGDRLVVEQRSGDLRLPATEKLWARIRSHRDLSRRCRQGLNRYR